jgi:glycosyltransferase involved in cell wall biosynthesis
MSNPLVSILMPAYNTERYINTAIKSILNQTFTDFELIIVNDGSTDDTENIIKLFTDSRIRYYKQENQGVAKALNYGLSKCTGRYIRRHDADDVSLPDALEKQITFLQKHPQYPMVSTQIAFMTENGKIAYKFKNPSNAFFNNNYSVEVTKDNYWANRPIIHATILAKRSLFIEVGNYRTQFPTSEDIDLWFRILEKYNVIVINECSYFVRLNEFSNTRVHGQLNSFYRELAYKFHKQREKTGSDSLMRKEQMPVPNKKNDNVEEATQNTNKRKCRLFRDDILNYQYRIFVNAKDWKLVWKSIKIALRDGWKLKRTWKAILFPLLGKRLVSIGVSIKQIFK